MWDYVDKDGHGQPLARTHEECCHNTLSGTGILFRLSPGDCGVLLYPHSQDVEAIAGVDGIGMPFIGPTKVAAPMKDNACETSTTPAIDAASAKISEPEGLFGISF